MRRPPSQPPVQAPSALASLDPMKLLRQYYPWLVASVIVGAIVGFGSYQVLRSVTPIWTAEVAYEVRAVAQSATDSIYGAGDRNEQEAYMNTLRQIIRSDAILNKALQERLLRETKWASQFQDASGNMDTVAALKKLRKIVSSRTIADTNILQIRVGTQHKDDAPNIVNSIHAVFLDDTGSRAGREQRDVIERFEGVIRDLNKDIESIDQRVEALFSREQLSSLNQQSTAQYVEVANLQPSLVRAREEYALTEQQLKTYEEMLNNPSGTVYPEAIREEVKRRPIIQEREAAIAGLKTAIRAQREQFGENHLEVRLLKRRQAAEEAERDALVEAQMRESFQTIVENIRNSLMNQQASLTQAEQRLRDAETRLQEITKVLKRHHDLSMEREEKLAKKATMEKDVSDLRMLNERGSRLKVLSTGQIPDELSFPKLIPMTAIGTVLIVGLAVGIIALREIREQRVRGPADVALIPRTRVLGVIPELSMDPSAPERMELASRDRPQGVIAESIRQLRNAMCKEMTSRGSKIVMVVGGLPGSGSTSVVTNLAINAAATDMRVLVIDANLRRPGIHQIFGLKEGPGVSDILLAQSSVESAIQPTSIPNLSVLTSGRRDIPVFERFTTSHMSNLFRDVRERFDLIIVDSTPGVVAGDAIAIASHCDASVLVLRAYAEKRGLVARLRNQLSDSGAEFMGVVVNGVRPNAGGYFKRNYQVSHEYGREAGTSEKTDASTKPAPASENDQKA